MGTHVKNTGPQRQNENTALNAKLKRGGGSKCQTKNDMMNLNAELEPWIWTPNFEETAALNARLERDDSERHNREWMVDLNA